MFIPFLAAIANSFGTVADKIALSKRKVPIKLFVPYVFLYLFVFSVIAAVVSALVLGEQNLGFVNWYFLQSPQFLFLFLIMIVLAITWNIFYYEALDKEKLSEFETIIMTAPLLTVVLSWLFFPETWDVRIGAAALVAAIALVVSHWEKHHLKLSHYDMNLLVAIVLMSTEDIVVTELLRDNVFSPVSLYAIRTFILFAFFFAYYRPNTKEMKRSNLNIIALSGVMGGIFMVLKYYGYRDLGIPYTALITIASPMSIYLASAFVMHERMKVKVVLSAAAIAGAIVYATSILASK